MIEQQCRAEEEVENGRSRKVAKRIPRKRGYKFISFRTLPRGNNTGEYSVYKKVDIVCDSVTSPTTTHKHHETHRLHLLSRPIRGSSGLCIHRTSTSDAWMGGHVVTKCRQPE